MKAGTIVAIGVALGAATASGQSQGGRARAEQQATLVPGQAQLRPSKLGTTPAVVAIARVSGPQSDEIARAIESALKGAGASVAPQAEFDALLATFHIDTSRLESTSFTALRDSLPATAVLAVDVTRAHIEQRHVTGYYDICDILPRKTTPCVPERRVGTFADITVLVSVYEPSTGKSWPNQRVTGSFSTSAASTDGPYPAYQDSMPVFREAAARVARSVAQLVRPWKAP
jgi:hypothetical protein